MSNRTDFDNVAQELCEALYLEDESGRSRKRIETELHDAFVAGQEQQERDEEALRAALTEALDGWGRWASEEHQSTPQVDRARIAELRKLVKP